jgi:hypothetical protein
VTAYFYTVKDKLGGATIVDCSNNTNGSGCEGRLPHTGVFSLTTNQFGQAFNLTNGATYFFSVRPQNEAGLVGGYNDSNGVTINFSKMPAHCNDTVLSPKETDIDCGDECPSCDVNKLCKVNADCKSRYCKNMGNVSRCAAAACNDTIWDGTETDVDCGGSCKTKCDMGKSCLSNSDCKSGTCFNNLCAATNTCMNGIHDGTETDVDCGGACPDKCGEGKQCMIDADCNTGYVCGDKVCRKCAEGEAGCGKPGDADGDGVGDDKDKCPGTATGAPVDVNGCSIDQRHSCGDSIPDSWRFKNGFAKSQEVMDCTGDAAANGDPDHDGLTNEEEFKRGTNPNNPDTDGDTWTDGQEVAAGTDPLDINDHPMSWFWIWIIIILLLALGVGGYFGYMEYKKRHPEKFKKQPGKPTLSQSLAQKLQEARARLAARLQFQRQRQRLVAKPTKPTGKPTEVKDEFVPLESLKGSEKEEFSRLKALEKRMAEEGKPLPKTSHADKGAMSKLSSLVHGKPEAKSNESASQSAPETKEQTLEKLSNLALSQFSEKERKDILKKLRLLRLGKLSTKDMEELLKKLRITAKYYDTHKQTLEHEVEAYATGKSVEEVKLKKIIQKPKVKK